MIIPVFVFKQNFFHVAKQIFLSLFRKNRQQIDGKEIRFLIYKHGSSSIHVVYQSTAVIILFFLVIFAGADTVNDHLRHILFRHLAPAHGHCAVRGDTVVDPVFEVVAVAALVVQPGNAHAVFPALLVIGTAEALVILGAPPELRGAVFAQIVQKTLPIQTQPETVVPYQTAVTVYGFQMLPNVHFPALQLQDRFSIAHFAPKGQGEKLFFWRREGGRKKENAPPTGGA